MFCEIRLWPHSSLLVLAPVECTLGAPTWEVPCRTWEGPCRTGEGPCRTWDARVAMTWRFKVALPASWDGPVDVVGRVGRQALEKHVFHDLCMLSSHSVFSDAFSQMVGDTQRLYLQFYEAIYLWRGWLVFVGYESSLNGIAFWASFSTMICWPSSFGCWIVWIQPHRKPTWKWKITFFKWLGFPVVILVFRGFSIWFVEILLLRLFGSNPSSSWKEISSPLLQKLPWRKFRMISYVSP